MSERETFSEIALENGIFETRVTRKFQGASLMRSRIRASSRQ